MSQVFTDEQVLDLDKKLDTLQVKQRKGSNGMLSYIEGHTAIDQANRLFGYGNWAFRTLSCEQAILLDPSTGEAVGVAYKAHVELIVRDCVGPIVEVGSQPVAAWNVRDVVMARRGKNANREKPIEEWEKVAAQRTIVEAHENAEKSAVTDAMKRALRTYGNQFGNGLYGDGKIDLPETQEQEDERATGAQNKPARIDAGKSTVQNATPLKQRLNAAYDKALALGVIEKGKTSEESGKSFLKWAAGVLGDIQLTNSNQLNAARLDTIEAYLNSQDAA